jgi:hypothetical protein
MANQQQRDREAYLNEQVARQQRGEPIDVEWVRAELTRVRQAQKQKLDDTQRQLRWLVIGTAILFSVLWIGGHLVAHRDPRILVPVALIATLAIWALLRRRRP